MSWRSLRAWLVPGGVIGVFSLVLNSGSLLKYPWSIHDDIPGSLAGVEQAVRADRWADANQSLTVAAVAFGHIRPRIQLSTERAELERFQEELAMLHGSLVVQDRSAAVQHLEMLKVLFWELGK
jgi:hypothetical protein